MPACNSPSPFCRPRRQESRDHDWRHPSWDRRRECLSETFVYDFLICHSVCLFNFSPFELCPCLWPACNACSSWQFIAAMLSALILGAPGKLPLCWLARNESLAFFNRILTASGRYHCSTWITTWDQHQVWHLHFSLNELLLFSSRSQPSFQLLDFMPYVVIRLVFVELKRSWTMVGPVSVPRPAGRWCCEFGG
jgi:hypothetical protein